MNASRALVSACRPKPYQTFSPRAAWVMIRRTREVGDCPSPDRHRGHGPSRKRRRCSNRGWRLWTSRRARPWRRSAAPRGDRRLTTRATTPRRAPRRRGRGAGQSPGGSGSERSGRGRKRPSGVNTRDTCAMSPSTASALRVPPLSWSAENGFCKCRVPGRPPVSTQRRNR